MYSIEGNLDFYKMVYETQDESEINIDNKCLITNDDLTQTHIVLECNHKFNYKSLFKDIYTRLYMCHDSKYSHRHLLSLKSIICPYCRNEQSQILPFIPEEYDMKIFGINTDDTRYKVHELNVPLYQLNKCSICDCKMYYHSDYKLPLCKKHGMNKKIVNKFNINPKMDFKIIINVSSENIENGCSFILTRGTRKGKMCNNLCRKNENLCKRHKDALLNK